MGRLDNHVEDGDGDKVSAAKGVKELEHLAQPFRERAVQPDGYRQRRRGAHRLAQGARLALGRGVVRAAAHLLHLRRIPGAERRGGGLPLLLAQCPVRHDPLHLVRLLFQQLLNLPVRPGRLIHRRQAQQLGQRACTHAQHQVVVDGQDGHHLCAAEQDEVGTHHEDHPRQVRLARLVQRQHPPDALLLQEGHRRLPREAFQHAQLRAHADEHIVYEWAVVLDVVIARHQQRQPLPAAEDAVRVRAHGREAEERINLLGARPDGARGGMRRARGQRQRRHRR
mmetsp:Transcript_12541/g.38837  ORF Transcript_12541/g.38837 Transcript_12541/m.38837 type:complete len:282 (+) Transcript_12541:1467-2312(+)